MSKSNPRAAAPKVESVVTTAVDPSSSKVDYFVASCFASDTHLEDLLTRATNLEMRLHTVLAKSGTGSVLAFFERTRDSTPYQDLKAALMLTPKPE